MPSSQRVVADALVIQVRSTGDAAFLAASIELGLRKHRADGSPLALSAGWDEVVAGLLELAGAALPPAEVVAEVSPTPAEVGRWLSTSETVDRFEAAGVRGGPRRVRQLLEVGDLIGRKDGTRWLIDPESVGAYVARYLERNVA